MKTAANKDINMATFKAALTEKDFQRLSEFIYTECGIKMPLAKKTMLESRLQKRLRALGIVSFKEYCDYIFSPAGLKKELIHMINVVTTNKTDFFREPNHFSYLTSRVLPEYISKQRTEPTRKLKVWSAGCSTGEEPYTLAMVLSEFALKCQDIPFDFLILATDISTKVLDKAMRAIYDQTSIAPVPQKLKKKYLLRSKDRISNLARIVPELREKVKFRRLNFLESDFGMREPMDIIFCRNVIIYFDRPTQEKLLGRFCRHLSPGGHILLGHSEALHGMELPLVQVAPTIYRKST